MATVCREDGRCHPLDPGKNYNISQCEELYPKNRNKTNYKANGTYVQTVVNTYQIINGKLLLIDTYIHMLHCSVYSRWSECNKRTGFVSDLQKIMAESRDYDELLFAWKGWRDSAGKVLRQDYKRYVELANKAATLNGMTFNFTSNLRKVQECVSCRAGERNVRISFSRVTVNF